MSVGAWPHATTIFDYIRRAMPHYAPKSLSDDQVYALTGYTLKLNGQLSENDILDKTTLAEIKMPSEVIAVYILQQEEKGKK